MARRNSLMSALQAQRNAQSLPVAQPVPKPANAGPAMTQTEIDSVLLDWEAFQASKAEIAARMR